MPGWIPQALAIGMVVVLVIITVALLLLRFLGWHGTTGISRVSSLQDSIMKLHQTNTGINRQLDLSSQRRPGYSVFCRGASARPLFIWADHPSLIMDAAENGWYRFAFLGYKSCPSSLPSLLGACPTGDPQGKGESEPVISWEATHGSANFMQKIRLNPGSKGVNSNCPVTAACVIKTALPLPGPPLGDSSFPQEAYFEIMILESGDDNDSTPTDRESERTKLILDDLDTETISEMLVHITSDQGSNRTEELLLNVENNGPDETVLLWVGLSAVDTLPLKLPGTYAGSIGFNSNGSLHHDGSKVLFESEKVEWGKSERVIGCGFDPCQKKVFFTVDSELVQVVHCKAEEYSGPLHPTLAANNDVTVLVNFRQAPFKYSPANTHRTSNPCFIGPLANSPAAASAMGYDSSRELFSMGRIDSQWLNQSVNGGSRRCRPNNSRRVDFDQESDADLFEIILDDWASDPRMQSRDH